MTLVMIPVGFGAVAAMSAHGYRVGSLLTGAFGLLVSGVVGRWAYRRRINPITRPMCSPLRD